MNGSGHRLGDFRSRYDGRHGIPVAHSFGHSDDVGYDAVSFETPKVFTCATETCLNLQEDLKNKIGFSTYENLIYKQRYYLIRDANSAIITYQVEC